MIPSCVGIKSSRSSRNSKRKTTPTRPRNELPFSIRNSRRKEAHKNFLRWIESFRSRDSKRATEFFLLPKREGRDEGEGTSRPSFGRIFWPSGTIIPLRPPSMKSHPKIIDRILEEISQH